MEHTAGIYRASYPDRDRWAVYSRTSRTWTFPTNYGERAARALARKLNKR